MKGQSLLTLAIIVALILIGFSFSDKIGIDKGMGALTGLVIGILMARRQR